MKTLIERFNLNKEIFTTENIMNASIYLVVFGLPIIFFLFLIQSLHPILLLVVVAALLIFGGFQVGEAVQRRRVSR